MTFFIFTNFFNYLDQGIIPGAASEFDAFITNSKEIDDDAAPIRTWGCSRARSWSA